jgi:dihydroorotate dehydrogenase (NAD+) catalytic subunit
MRAMATLEPGAAAGAERRAAVPDAATLLGLRFCGMDFASPIVLLSGCVGFGEEYTRIEGFSNRDAGAVVLKGTTGEPRLGNPPHRVYETPAGMLNAIGLQNPGVEQVVHGILPQLDFTETRFIANVSGSTIEEYVAVINTIMGMAIDVHSRRPVMGNVQGGLSGPAIKPIALLKVHQVYEVARPHAIPIIGQGGITTGNDALEFIIAGASAVGIGTALFYDPMVCKTINAGIARYLRGQGLSNVTELVGTLRTGSDTQDCALSG